MNADQQMNALDRTCASRAKSFIFKSAFIGVHQRFNDLAFGL
jgi:hypothetical protein